MYTYKIFVPTSRKLQNVMRTTPQPLRLRGIAQWYTRVSELGICIHDDDGLLF